MMLGAGKRAQEFKRQAVRPFGGKVYGSRCFTSCHTVSSIPVAVALMNIIVPGGEIAYRLGYGHWKSLANLTHSVPYFDQYSVDG